MWPRAPPHPNHVVQYEWERIQTVLSLWKLTSSFKVMLAACDGLGSFIAVAYRVIRLAACPPMERWIFLRVTQGFW